MLFLYTHPYPSREGSQDENEYLISMEINGTKIDNLSFYHKVGACIQLSREFIHIKKRRDKYQPKSINFKIEEKKQQLRVLFKSIPTLD